MTAANLWRWVLVVGASGLGIFTTALPAGQTNVLIRYDSVWKYHDAGEDLGTAWREVDYDASAWVDGAGVFAFPADEPLPLPAVLDGAQVRTLLTWTNTAVATVRTYYFRIRFSVPAYSGWPLLVFSNLLDDGAVFYWNGQEIHRQYMPTGLVQYATYANYANEVSQGVIVFSNTPAHLPAEEHELAVEIHQRNITSNDAVFGLSLSLWVITPPEILMPPADTMVDEGQPFTLAVGAAGEALTYQWQQETTGGVFTNLDGATHAAYAVTSARLADADQYRVVVSNVAGSVTSQVAQVTIVPDQTGPALVSAIAREAGTAYRLGVLFSETVDVASGRLAANYRLENLDTGERPAFTVLGFPQGPLVTLQVTDFNPTARYRLTVNQVKDRYGNGIAPDSPVPVWVTVNLPVAPMDHLWRWTDDNVPLPPEWTTNLLEPYLYGEAAGVLFNSFGNVDFCRGARNTWISLGPKTHYFSTQLLLPDARPEGALTLVALVDDGAALYLNGVECFRFNLPDGPLNHLTPATQNIANAVCMTNYVTVTNLQPGVNVLAAEVHQSAVSSSPDVVFGLDVQAEVTPAWQLPATPAPVLRLEQLDPQVTLSWTGGGWALEWADAVTGPWREVQPNLANPHTTTLTNAANRFWRLKQTQF